MPPARALVDKLRSVPALLASALVDATNKTKPLLTQIDNGVCLNNFTLYSFKYCFKIILTSVRLLAGGILPIKQQIKQAFVFSIFWGAFKLVGWLWLTQEAQRFLGGYYLRMCCEKRWFFGFIFVTCWASKIQHQPCKTGCINFLKQKKALPRQGFSTT